MLQRFKYTLSLAAILTCVASSPLYAYNNENDIATNTKCQKANFSRNTGKCAGKKFPLLVPKKPTIPQITNFSTLWQYINTIGAYNARLTDITGQFIDSTRNTEVHLSTDPETIISSPIELDDATILFGSAAPVSGNTISIAGDAASQLVRLNDAGTKRECWLLTNNSKVNYFIPLKTDEEWESFKNATEDPFNTLKVTRSPCGSPTITTPIAQVPPTGGSTETFGCSFVPGRTDCDSGAVGNVYKLRGRYNLGGSPYWENNPADGAPADYSIPADLCVARERARDVDDTRFIMLRAEYLNIPPQSWDKGFPGATSLKEGFAVDYNGRIYVDEEGDYEFLVVSDDAAILQIADSNTPGATLNTILNDNNIHHYTNAKGAFVRRLTAGFHDFRLVYAQLPRTQIALQFMWRKKTDGNTAGYSFVTMFERDPSVPDTCGTLPAQNFVPG